jgi:ABC-type antimicrobial peptide transport system permease subunit
MFGVAASLGATRLVTSFLYGMTAAEPSILAGSVLLLAAIGVVAAALPAWRAARMDPVAALREE